MATFYNRVFNLSQQPCVYVGRGNYPTGWGAYAFGPVNENPFSWQIQTDPHDQAMLTMGGFFHIWDDGDWSIMYQQPGGPPKTLIKLIPPPDDPLIDLTVIAGGTDLTAKQIFQNGAPTG